MRSTARFPALASLAGAMLSAAPEPRTLVAAYGNSLPMVMQDSEGKPGGFAVDVFNEAARRAGITLRWKFANSIRGNNEALRRGEIDIVPTGAATAERRKEFYVSSPWWAYGLVALAPAAGAVRIEEHLNGKRLATPRVAAEQVARLYPGSTVLEVGSSTAAAEMVCTGQADAALLADAHLRELLFAASPSCAEVKLDGFNTAARQDFVLVARREVAPLAEELRRRVDELALDGTLTGIAVRHAPISPPYASRIAEMLRLRQQRRMWTIWLSCGGALMVLAGLFLYGQFRNNRRLHALNLRLQESDERWQFALEGAGAGVWDWDAATNTTYYSRYCKLMLGFDEDEAADVREEWDRRIHPDDRAGTRERLERHIAGQTPVFAAEYRLQCKDGSYKWILARGKVTGRDAEGRPRRCLGTFTDITSMKVAEEEGARLHELYLRAQAGTIAGDPCSPSTRES